MAPEGLVAEPTSTEEVAALLGVFAQQLADAEVTTQSVDGRYVDAYSAASTLAKLVVRASGYRVKGSENHKDTWLAVPWCMGSRTQGTADRLSSARTRRNRAMYDVVGSIEEEDVVLLIMEVRRFHSDVLAWLRECHSELIG